MCVGSILRVFTQDCLFCVEKNVLFVSNHINCFFFLSSNESNRQ